MATTYKIIRSQQVALINALVATELPAHRFRFWQRNEPNFAAWASASSGPFRVFEIEHGLDYSDEKYLDEDTESVVHTQTVLVSYPQVREFEGRLLDDIIDDDITLITKTIGTRGYGSYAVLGAGEHKAERIGCGVELRPGARVLMIKFQLDYDRTIT